MWDLGWIFVKLNIIDIVINVKKNENELEIPFW